MQFLKIVNLETHFFSYLFYFRIFRDKFEYENIKKSQVRNRDNYLTDILSEFTCDEESGYLLFDTYYTHTPDSSK